MDELSPKDHAEAVALFRSEIVGALLRRDLVLFAEGVEPGRRGAVVEDQEQEAAGHRHPEEGPGQVQEGETGGAQGHDLALLGELAQHRRDFALRGGQFGQVGTPLLLRSRRLLRASTR